MRLNRQMELQQAALFLPKKIGKRLQMQVVLGSPSAGCQDVGICRVIPADVHVQIKCPVLISWLSITELGNIRFAFLQDSISAQMMRKHFRWGLFQVIEVFEVPEAICRQLKLAKYAIKPGIYQVVVQDEYIVIDL